MRGLAACASCLVIFMWVQCILLMSMLDDIDAISMSWKLSTGATSCLLLLALVGAALVDWLDGYASSIERQLSESYRKSKDPLDA